MKHEKMRSILRLERYRVLRHLAAVCVWTSFGVFFGRHGVPYWFVPLTLAALTLWLWAGDWVARQFLERQTRSRK